MELVLFLKNFLNHYLDLQHDYNYHVKTTDLYYSFYAVCFVYLENV